jgi:hypothetical protein
VPITSAVGLFYWLYTMDGELQNDSDHLIIPPSEEDVELTGCAAKPCCNPTHWLYRFIALLFMSLLGFGKTAEIFTIACFFSLSLFAKSHRLLHISSISYNKEVLAVVRMFGT